MKKVSVMLIMLAGIVFFNCNENSGSVDLQSLVTITSGFSSSYMVFKITAGPDTVVAAVPEYELLNGTTGLIPDGVNYDGVFASTTPSLIQSVSIVLPSPAKGTAYLEDSPNLFTYTRNSMVYTINTDYTTGNDFRIDIVEWNGTRKYMDATFSGIVCNGASITDCLTIEGGVIHALVR